MINEWGKKEVKIEVNQINYYDCYLIFNVVKMKSTTLSLSLSHSQTKKMNAWFAVFHLSRKKSKFNNKNGNGQSGRNFKKKKQQQKKCTVGLLDCCHTHIYKLYISTD